MNTTHKTPAIPVEFADGADTAIDVEIKFLDPINRIKRDIFKEFQPKLGANEHLLSLALIEADALAQQTEFPNLFFPLLASEKAANAARWQFRQQFLLRSNSPYPLAA
jgi:hypothetical protein